MYEPFEALKVYGDPKSITVPDMSFTPREILAKFSRGEKVPLGMEGVFDYDDSSLDDLDQSVFEEDPTRDPNFDSFDYVEEKLALDERMSEQTKRSKAASAEDSERKASAEESSVKRDDKAGDD